MCYTTVMDNEIKNTWYAMLSRCHNPNTVGYPRYGGRGITVCERWHSFQHFVEDMGERPPGHSIERLDNNRGYEPDNCVWATPKEQSRNQITNRRLTLGDRCLTLTEWAECLGTSTTTIARRIDDYGWSEERALSTPVRPQRGATSFTKKDREKIMRLVRDGTSHRQVAKRFDTSHVTIAYICRGAVRPVGAQKKLTAVQLRSARRWRTDGHSLAEIGRRLSVSRATVRRALA